MDFLESTTHLSPALILAMGIYLGCLAARRLAELAFPGLKDSSKKLGFIWRELMLPFLPVLMSSTFTALVTAFPYPSVFGESVVLRIVYGAVVGFFSSWAYRILKVIIQRKWDVELPDLLEMDPASKRPRGD